MRRYSIYAQPEQICLKVLKTSSETCLKKKSLQFQAEDVPTQEVVCAAVGNGCVGNGEEGEEDGVQA